MDTHIVRSVDGQHFNRCHEQVIDCSNDCGRKTTMIGTQLCDHCWEGQRRVELEARLAQQR